MAGLNSDELAAIRTHLANERTLLAYARTALGFVAAGVGVFGFFHAQFRPAVGWTLIGIGVMIAIFGVIRFLVVHRRL